jgi:hypothetical protein
VDAGGAFVARSAVGTMHTLEYGAIGFLVAQERGGDAAGMQQELVRCLATALDGRPMQVLALATRICDTVTLLSSSGARAIKAALELSSPLTVATLLQSALGVFNSMARRGVAVRHVVINPSSSLYFDTWRPQAGGGWAEADADACPKFNDWKYGWGRAPAYATQQCPVPAVCEARFRERDVRVLLGTADDDATHPSLDNKCGAAAQGT